MTFEQLECFLSVERFMSFSAAADELGISQSTLSKHIKALECELEVKLFYRNTRKTYLSDPGAEFSFYASKMFLQYKKMKISMKNYNQENSRRCLRIASIPVLCQYGLTSMIMDFKQLTPELEIEISEMDPNLAMEALENGDADLSIIRIRQRKDYRVQIFPLIDDELVMITNINHRFATKGIISLHEAENEKFLLLGDNTGWHDTCIEECVKAGFVPHVENFDLRVGTIKNMVANGAGISLLNFRVAKYIDAPDISIIRLAEHPMTTLSIITNKDSIDKLSMDFINYTSNRFKDSK